MIEGKRILIINSNAAGIPGAAALAHSGAHVDTAEGSAAGLERLGSAGYDIVIVQAGPGTESWQLCERIRRHYGMPLIVISPNADAEACVRAIDAGADFFLRKTCGPLELLARVRLLLQRLPRQPEPAVS